MNINAVLFTLPQSLQDGGRRGDVGYHIIILLDLFKEGSGYSSANAAGRATLLSLCYIMSHLCSGSVAG